MPQTEEGDNEYDEFVKSTKSVTPAPVITGINCNRSAEPIENTGSLLEFTPVKTGAGMTIWRKSDFLRFQQVWKFEFGICFGFRYSDFVIV